MGEFFFGLGPGHLGKRAARIARKHDAALVNYTEPNGTKRHWFRARNTGAPFDQKLAAVVLQEIGASAK